MGSAKHGPIQFHDWPSRIEPIRLKWPYGRPRAHRSLPRTPARRLAWTGQRLRGARRTHPPAHRRRAHRRRHPAARRARPRRAARPQPHHGDRRLSPAPRARAPAQRARLGQCRRLPGAPAMLPAPLETEYIDFSKAAPPALPWLPDVAQAGRRRAPGPPRRRGLRPDRHARPAAAIADRYTARGLPTTPEQIMVTIGAQHAIALLSRALIGRATGPSPRSPSTRTPTRPSVQQGLAWCRSPSARAKPATTTAMETAGLVQASATRTRSRPTSSPTSTTRPAAP